MASITLDADLSGAANWSAVMARQMPFATSLALNRTAFDIRQIFNYETTRFFDQPVPFTQRAFLVERSTKQNLEAVVYAEARRARYLRFGIDGGLRPQKGLEAKFLGQQVGNIPRGAQLRPTGAVKRNAAGNVGLATLRAISGKVATTGPNSVMIGQPRGGGRPPGIYRRAPGGKLRPLFIADNSRAAYRPRFPIGQIGTQVAEQRFMGYLVSSLEQALATAR
jgi:hypothetical protein